MVSPEVTQNGVARGSGIEVRHVRQFVRPLIREGLVRERQAHIQGGRQRRLVYELTREGQLAARRLRDEVVAEVIPVRDKAGTRTMTVADALRTAGGRLPLHELVQSVERAGLLDLTAPMPTPSAPFIAMITGAPQVKTFVGRQRELRAVTSDADRPRIFVVRGVAGIGKSFLAAKACEILRGHRNLYWHRLRPWDTSLSLLAGLGDFLSALKRPELRTALSRGEAGRIAEVLHRDLPGTRSFLVFDDVHEASKEALGAFRALTDAIAGSADSHALLLTRRSLGFYDRREVELAGIIRELDLGGLESSEVAAFLAAEEDGPQLAALGRQLGGHPLFLELLRSSASAPGDLSGLTSVRRFVREAIYRELSEPEREMMKLAALYRTPISRVALLRGPGSNYEVLLGLEERALLRRVGEDRFEVHDTIRDYFESILAEDEKSALADFAIRQLRTLASAAESASDYPPAVDYLSNALELPMPGSERTVLLEELGDVQQGIGDLPEMLAAYRAGIASTEDPETIARFHRKTARDFIGRDEPRSAANEIEAGLAALGAVGSVERGWLEMMRGAVVAETDRADIERTIASLSAGIKAFREWGEKEGEMETLIFFGYFRQFLGHLDEAERCYGDALALATAVEDRRFMADAHGRLAYFHGFFRPNLDAALDHLRAMESLVPHLDYFRRSYAAWWKGLIQAELLGDLAEAETTLSEHVALARQTYDAGSIFLGNGELANVAYYRGRVAEARGRCEEQWREALVARWMSCNWPIEYGVNSLWMAAECCLIQGDRPGFQRRVAELDLHGIQERATHRMVVIDVLRGLQAFIRKDEVGFRSFFARGLEVADRAIASRMSPIEVPAYLVPFFYGTALAVQGKGDEGASYIARALNHLQAYGMKARLKTLVQGQDRFVQVLREWTGDHRSMPGIDTPGASPAGPRGRRS